LGEAGLIRFARKNDGVRSDLAYLFYHAPCIFYGAGSQCGNVADSHKNVPSWMVIMAFINPLIQTPYVFLNTLQ